MAKQRFGINDAYRGAVGTVIGYEWRGQWCLRSRPRRVRNPRTEKQQLNRLLFKQMVQLAGVLKTVLRVGMHRSSLSLHMTECNLFVKNNKECFSLDGEGHMAVDWENVVVSDGPLAAPEFTGAETLGDTVEFRFGGEGDGDDDVHVVAYCPEEQATVESAATARRTGMVRIALPEAWHGKEVHLWGFATDYRGEASVSVYLGLLTAEEEKRTSAPHTKQSQSPLSKNYDKDDIPCWRMLLGHTALSETNQRCPRDTDRLRQRQLRGAQPLG